MPGFAIQFSKEKKNKNKTKDGIDYRVETECHRVTGLLSSSDYSEGRESLT